MASKSIFSTKNKTAEKHPEDPETNLKLGACSSDVPYPTQNYVYSIFEETTMTVREAECATDSDSDLRASNDK